MYVCFSVLEYYRIIRTLEVLCGGVGERSLQCHGIKRPPKVMSSRTAERAVWPFCAVEAKAACGVCLKGGVQWGVLCVCGNDGVLTLARFSKKQQFLKTFN